MARKLTAVGITCGIGSMLVGARQAGFEILGNVEWRKYYSKPDEHGRTTFGENFPGAIFRENVDGLEPAEIERLMNADLALGHPECGNFSQLGGVNKHRLEKLNDASDIPLFVDLVAKFQPSFIVMDDLPKSFVAFPMKEYVDRLPGYDLFPEWVSNWGYGNVQKFRNRMFMIGAKKSERWAFVPSEAPHTGSVRSVLEDLPEPRSGSNFPNHDPCEIDGLAQKNLSMRYIGDRPTWRQVSQYAQKHWPPGASMNYFANDGSIKKKPGCKTEWWDGPASVQDGGSYKIHPIRWLPLTLRERARIQGFPDDFVFYGAKLNTDGEYNPDRNVTMSKQTGKAMPIQFCRYVSRQVAAHLNNDTFKATGERLLPNNEFVDQAKQWYCENVGYANQERACSSCWLYSGCTIRMRKYKIGEPAVGQRDLIDPGVVPGPEPVKKIKAPRVVAAPRTRTSSRFVDVPREEERDLDFNREDQK